VIRAIFLPFALLLVAGLVVDTELKEEGKSDA